MKFQMQGTIIIMVHNLIFFKGRCHILKCLLDIRQLLYSGDDHYILNDLYITDYCVWIQSVRSESKLFVQLREIYVFFNIYLNINISFEQSSLRLLVLPQFA